MEWTFHCTSPAWRRPLVSFFRQQHPLRAAIDLHLVVLLRRPTELVRLHRHWRWLLGPQRRPDPRPRRPQASRLRGEAVACLDHCGSYTLLSLRIQHLRDEGELEDLHGSTRSSALILARFQIMAILDKGSLYFFIFTWLCYLIIPISCANPTLQSPKFALTDFENETGYAPFVAFMVGLSGLTTAFGGTDAITHISEEVHTPERDVPRSEFSFFGALERSLGPICPSSRKLGASLGVLKGLEADFSPQ
jgi:hypothetical protein